MFRKHLFLLFFVLMSAFAFSQPKWNSSMVISAEPRWGFVAPHHDYMAYFLNKNITAFELNVGWQTTGIKSWHSKFNYPVIGFGVYHSGLGNDYIYGNLTGLYSFINRYYFPNSGRFNFGNRLGVGLSYISKHYDLQTNPTDIAIGSHVNCFIQFEFLFTWNVNKKFNVTGTVGALHASNGNLKEPNKGFNIVNLGVAATYRFNSFESIRAKAPIYFADTSKQYFTYGVFGSGKVLSRFTNNIYPVYGVSAEYLRRINCKSLIGLELSGYYDASMHDLFKDYDILEFKNSYYLLAAANVTYGLQMGKFLITIQPGIYLRSREQIHGLISNKIGFRYTFFKNYSFSVNIKAHWLAQADFIEFGLKRTIRF